MLLSGMKVVATGKLREAAVNFLEDKVTLYTWQKGGRPPEDEFKERLAEADALYSISNMPINDALLAQAPHLKVVAQASVGYDNIDLAACKARGVRVGNTPGVLADAVADLAYALILDSARMLVRGAEHVRSGAWGERKGLGFGVDLAGKTLGIFGLGTIGQAVVPRAQASKMKIIYHNTRQRKDDSVLGVTYVAWEDLLAQADFLYVSAPLTPETKGLFDGKAFAAMKRGARFINTARGKIVDTQALYEALQSGQLAAAAIDVVDPEPLPAGHPLLSLPNITITPHIGTSTVETRDAMAILTAKNIIAALSGEPMPAEVSCK